MSDVITGELHFLVMSVAWGAVMASGYELLRLVRLVLRHGQTWTGLEDLLFWTICAVLLFAMVLRENDGTIRWYVLAGATAGACAYQYFIHPVLVWVLRPLLKPARFLRRFVHNLLKKDPKSITLKTEKKVYGTDEPKDSKGEESHGRIRKEKAEKAEQTGHARHYIRAGSAGGRTGVPDRAAPEKRR